ncbi:MAG: histone deacetylase superfamily protein [Polaromonas sp.]|nr:histone deacetylase superfamily protein [Polaromonas sp.]
MICITNPQHHRHAPAFEIFRGNKVPCHETPQRAENIELELVLRGHMLCAPHIDSRATLEQVHSRRYLKFFENAWQHWLQISPAHADLQPFPSVWPVRSLRSDIEPKNFTACLGLYSMDNGCALVEGSWPAAKAAADAAASAAALLLAGEQAVFCCTRPPGHHAGADFMGGYCFLNNAAVAAQALRDGGLVKVALLDVDYHHGNGSQSIFYQRHDVLFVSIHGDPLTEYPFYLGHADECGAGEGEGFNLNLPLPAGSRAEAWFAALESACVRISAYQPQALVVSLGLDTFGGDPISTFSLHSNDFTALGEQLARLGLPVIFVLEGGYAAAELGINAANVMDGYERVCSQQAAVGGQTSASETTLGAR